MAATITLKNIPDELYERLKEVAELHHRSLNMEALACLEQTLMPRRVSGEERLARARRLRADLDSGSFHARDIDEAIEQDRP